VTADVQAVLAPYTGAGRDFGDVQHALEALEALYRARGYDMVTVQLPEQELNGGAVRLVGTHRDTPSSEHGAK